MKKLAAAVAVAGLLGTPAFAADMAVKAPPSVAPAPAYNWTGWYVGVNAGASFGSAKTDFNNSPVVITGGPGTATFPVPFVGSDRTNPDGFIGGGQIGYNWQISPIWVAGLEADFQGAIEKDSNTPFFNSFTSTAVLSIGGTRTITGNAIISDTAKIDWFGTVRGRFGYVWGNGTVFSYVTGGLAYGKVDFSGTSGIVSTTGGLPFAIAQSFGHNQVNTGWVLGYGTEGVIDFWGARNWTWKIEGLYMDLGTMNTTGAATGIVNPGNGFAVTSAGLVATHTHFTDGILRGGLNYKFY